MERLLKVLVAITCIAVIASVGKLFWGDAAARLIDDFRTPPVARACEQVLIGRLKSPSGYERIAISQTARQVNAEEYKKAKLVELRNIEATDIYRKAYAKMSEKIAEIESGKSSPTRYNVDIVYDAPNGYGTPIRDHADCSYTSWNGPLSRGSTIYTSMIRVDGKTNLERITDRLAKGTD